MKRTFLVLATVTTLILMSCNHIDNSISSAEDMNSPQTLSQTKALPNGLLAGELTPIKENNFFLAKKSEMSSAEEYSSIEEESNTRVAYSTRNVSCGPMSVTNVPYGYWARSSEAYCNFTNLPAGSMNLAYEFFPNSYSVNINGTFTVTNLIIECGDYGAAFNWEGHLPSVGTYAFQGTDANVLCKVSFYGKCAGTGNASPGNLLPLNCSFGYSNTNMTSFYM